MAAMVFGLLFFAEIPTPLSLFGLVLTVLAMALLAQYRRDQIRRHIRPL